MHCTSTAIRKELRLEMEKHPPDRGKTFNCHITLAPSSLESPTWRNQYPQAHGWRRTLVPLPGGHTGTDEEKRTKKGRLLRPKDTELRFPNQGPGAAEKLFGASRRGVSAAGFVLLNLYISRKAIKISAFKGTENLLSWPSHGTKEKGQFPSWGGRKVSYRLFPELPMLPKPRRSQRVNLGRVTNRFPAGNPAELL